MKYMMRAFRIMSIVSEWCVVALSDGKVTAKEAIDLITSICGVLKIPLELDFSDYVD